jgi:hypothetical protein
VNKAKGGFSLKQENYNKELEKEKENLTGLRIKPWKVVSLSHR